MTEILQHIYFVVIFIAFGIGWILMVINVAREEDNLGLVLAAVLALTFGVAVAAILWPFTLIVLIIWVLLR